MTEKTSEKLIKKIRKEVLRGKSKYRVAKDLGLAHSLVYKYTSDIPNSPPRELSIKGEYLEILQELLRKGFVYTSGNRGHLRFLQRLFPVIKRSQFNNRSIYYLEDKNKLALQEMIRRDKSRIISYRELSRMTQVFNTDISMHEKKQFLGKKTESRSRRSRIKKSRKLVFSKMRQSLLDEFLGRFLHAEVLSCFCKILLW